MTWDWTQVSLTIGEHSTHWAKSQYPSIMLEMSLLIYNKNNKENFPQQTTTDTKKTL